MKNNDAVEALYNAGRQPGGATGVPEKSLVFPLSVHMMWTLRAQNVPKRFCKDFCGGPLTHIQFHNFN